MPSERQQAEQSQQQQQQQQRALRRKIVGERAILKRARAMTAKAFQHWKYHVRLVKRVERFQRKRGAQERKRLLSAWRVVAMRESKEREERRRLVRMAFRAWLARVRARNRRGSDDDVEEADNGKNEERRREKEEEDYEKEKEKERNSLLARRMFHRWHVSALTRKRNEREKEFIKLEVREKFVAAKARETKARWKSEARRTRACQDALETLRIAAVKDLEGEKENACERNSKDDDEKFSHKRRERLREALMKQKARLLEEIEREENREQIRARFGN
jgi:hypothetical protein